MPPASIPAGIGNIRWNNQHSDMKRFNFLLIVSTLFMLFSGICNAQVVINIRYDYFFPADDPEDLLLIDEWADQDALNRYHSSPMMQEAAALREKYNLGGRQVRMFQPVGPRMNPAGQGRRPER